MAFSIIQTTATGASNSFPINFTLGFNNRNEVTCQVNDEVDGLGAPVYRTLSWVNDGLVNVLPATLIPVGQKVVFKRTVTKTALLHDYSNGEAIEEENLDESNKQNLMAIHELFDGRFTSAFQQDLDMGTHKITNVVAGTNPTDAVNKAQLDIVDGHATGQAAAAAASAAAAQADRILADADVVLTHADVVLTHADVVSTGIARDQAVSAANDMKYRAARLAATSPITLSGTQTIDGVAAVVGDRVVVTAQAVPATNGVYTVASGAWVRAFDADTWNELVGIIVNVEEGTANHDLNFLCTSDLGGTLGTTAVNFIIWQAYIPDGTIATVKLGGDVTSFGKSVLTAASAAALRTLIDTITPAYLSNNVCDGRLTLTSGVPVTSSAVTSSTIYYTPYKGNRISLYDGTRWNLLNFTEQAIPIGTVTAAIGYDIFAYNNAGSLTFDIVPWTSATARATAIVIQDGVRVKSGALTRRYIGSFYPQTTTTVTDSEQFRCLWNMYNRAPRSWHRRETTASWGYAAATPRYANDNSSNVVARFAGLDEDAVSCTLLANASANALSTANVNLGIDGVNSTGGNSTFTHAGNGYYGNYGCAYVGYIGMGYHFFAHTEIGNTGATTIWTNQQGLDGVVLA